ncbi:apolipoprotein N-acyltransferase [Paraflavisolibacter sp. H34]|uniref:apolipoprotein N-acyltransferase n=1 Tax=Huijunlia imazamoxiresistens TaxID=3127457 RepID=UPI0030181350
MLLWAAWPTSSFTFLIFFALVPLLWIEDHTGGTKKLFGYTYLHMLLWNVLTTWWVGNATAVGAGLAILLNSLLMCLPWLLMHRVKRTLGRTAGYVSLIAFWISFEYIHHNWELSWPWLTLGNAFALQTGWIQWYEATGTTGGTLWVLLSNVLFYGLLTEYLKRGRSGRYFGGLALLLLLLIVPILVSKNLLKRESQKIAVAARNATKNVVVVQPNIDPYNEKFAEGTVEAQVQNLINLSEKQVDNQTALLVWPETAVPAAVWEGELEQNPYFQPVFAFLSAHPQLSLLTGIASFKSYGTDKAAATPTSRFHKTEHFYYDEFNAATLLAAQYPIAYYHKAKLVPGVETLPSFLLWLNVIFEKFGGASGALGSDKERAVFADKQHYYLAAPIICYESIYSNYITGFVRKGANILTIITNDGWWGNTQGYRQHMNYGRLRAIETRRWVARSANTGISCFIDPAGTVYQPQPWDTPASIKMNIEPIEHQTFFVRHGDYLSLIFNTISLIALAGTSILFLRRRFSQKTT